MADEWTAVSGYTPQDYTDTAVFEVDSDTKKIALITGQALVAGEKNSQYIKFVLPRYWDGIDISGKTFSVEYALSGQYYGTSEAVNAEMSAEQVRFGWVVPEEACCISGKLLFVLRIESADYILKSQIVEVSVYKSINVEDVVPEPTREAWYREFEARVEVAIDEAEAALAQAQQAVTSAETAAQNAQTAEDNAEAAAASAQTRYGSPLVATTADEMTDENRVYVYVGSESGYTNGNWYYYDGTAWVSGGVYNGTGINTDTTLTQSGMAADAKATGDEISQIKEDLNTTVMNYHPHDETITDSKLLATGYHNILTDWYTDLTTEFGTSKYGNLQVWGYNGQKYQVIIFEDGSMFTRWVSRDGTNAGTWKAIKDNRRKGKYYAFGDSRTYGLIGGTSTQSAYRYPKYIADALTMSYANYAVSGSGLFERTDTGKPAALTTIQSKDISDATLITIEYGINDWRNPIGTYEDTGDTTWCGKLYQVIQYISQTVPNATLVIIGSANTLEGTQATDYGYGYTTASGWSLGKLIDEEAKLCAKYHVPFISGYDSPLNNFVLASHMSADTIHLDDEGHRMRSEYLLGKIKTFYTLTA